MVEPLEKMKGFICLTAVIRFLLHVTKQYQMAQRSIIFCLRTWSFELMDSSFESQLCCILASYVKTQMSHFITLLHFYKVRITVASNAYLNI